MTIYPCKPSPESNLAFISGLFELGPHPHTHTNRVPNNRSAVDGCSDPPSKTLRQRVLHLQNEHCTQDQTPVLTRLARWLRVYPRQCSGRSAGTSQLRSWRVFPSSATPPNRTLLETVDVPDPKPKPKPQSETIWKKCRAEHAVTTNINQLLGDLGCIPTSRSACCLAWRISKSTSISILIASASAWAMATAHSLMTSAALAFALACAPSIITSKNVDQHNIVTTLEQHGLCSRRIYSKNINCNGSRTRNSLCSNRHAFSFTSKKQFSVLLGVCFVLQSLRCQSTFGNLGFFVRLVDHTVKSSHLNTMTKDNHQSIVTAVRLVCKKTNLVLRSSLLGLGGNFNGQCDRLLQRFPRLGVHWLHGLHIDVGDNESATNRGSTSQCSPRKQLLGKNQVDASSAQPNLFCGNSRRSFDLITGFVPARNAALSACRPQHTDMTPMRHPITMHAMHATHTTPRAPRARMFVVHSFVCIAYLLVPSHHRHANQGRRVLVKVIERCCCHRAANPRRHCLQ